MKILIAGGAGFIGSNLAKYHLDKNDNVIVVDNLITGSKKNVEPFSSDSNFEFIGADTTTYDFSSLAAFDIVYNLASPASPIQYKNHPVETLLANSQGNYRLLEFFKKSQSGSFVLTSTSETYGDPLVHPQTEDYWGNVNPVGVRACYDESKRFAEALTMTYFRKYKLNVRIARIFNTYGPNMEKQDGRVVSNFIVQTLTNQPITIYGNGKQTRSFCYVDDMVKGLYFLGTTKNIAGEVINLGNPIEKNMLELAEIIKKLTNSPSSITYAPIDGDDPCRRKPDITKAKKLLNWQPSVGLEEGLNKTINYFRERFSL